MNDFISQPSPIESLISGSIGVWGVLNADASQVAARRNLRAALDDRTDIYSCLNELLSSGEDDRFVLYCPLELIPHADQYRQEGEAYDTFAELYVQSWRRLLMVKDARADFIDGDIPDIEDGMMPTDMVSQAAYLTPILIENGLLSANSLSEAEKEIIREANSPRPHPNPIVDMRIPLDNFQQFVMQELYGWEFCTLGISQKRLQWLKSSRRRRIIENIGYSLGSHFAKGNKIIALESLDNDALAAIVVGIRSAIENSPSLYEKFKDDLFVLAQKDSLYTEITKTFCRLHSIGVVDQETLKKLQIFYPNLSGPFYDNLSPSKAMNEIVMDLLDDDELMKIIYPANIIYGSQLKGYSLGGDIDRAVFVRPGVQDRSAARELIQERLGGDVVEYWLDENFRIRDFPKLEAKTGESTNTHVLFGGVWEGDSETISMLGERVLRPYLYNSDLELRKLWLREMERDTLQYRLLHRGYETFNVPRTREVFWDEGYRWMAAKLYASHVWMPRGV